MELRIIQEFCNMGQHGSRNEAAQAPTHLTQSSPGGDKQNLLETLVQSHVLWEHREEIIIPELDKEVLMEEMIYPIYTIDGQ